MNDDIKLPELPAGFKNHSLSGHDEAVFTDLQMAEYARAAVLADREKDGVTLEGCLETLFKIGEHLGLDYSASRSAEGKPSDVYIKAIEAKVRAAVAAVLEDAERYRWVAENLVLNGVMRFGVPHPIQNKAGWDAAIDAARAAGGEA